MSLRVIVVDDHQMVRDGFAALLAAQPDITVAATAADGAAAVTAVQRLRAQHLSADVVLMDVRMPVLDGLEAAAQILTGPGDTKVVMVTTFDADEYVYEALRIGASGFILKDATAAELVQAVRVAAAGDALLAPSITRRLIASLAGQWPARHTPDELAVLTPRETEVLSLIATGASNAEIADGLVIAEETVKTHVGRILAKLGLRDRVQAVVLAYETRLARPQDNP